MALSQPFAQIGDVFTLPDPKPVLAYSQQLVTSAIRVNSTLRSDPVLADPLGGDVMVMRSS